MIIPLVFHQNASDWKVSIWIKTRQINFSNFSSGKISTNKMASSLLGFISEILRFRWIEGASSIS